MINKPKPKFKIGDYVIHKPSGHKGRIRERIYSKILYTYIYRLGLVSVYSEESLAKFNNIKSKFKYLLQNLK